MPTSIHSWIRWDDEEPDWAEWFGAPGGLITYLKNPDAFLQSAEEAGDVLIELWAISNYEGSGFDPPEPPKKVRFDLYDLTELPDQNAALCR